MSFCWLPSKDMPVGMQFLYKWAHGWKGRMKGFVRKLLLKQANR